jgi:hypothetical protein
LSSGKTIKRNESVFKKVSYDLVDKTIRNASSVLSSSHSLINAFKTRAASATTASATTSNATAASELPPTRTTADKSSGATSASAKSPAATPDTAAASSTSSAHRETIAETTERVSSSAPTPARADSATTPTIPAETSLAVTMTANTPEETPLIELEDNHSITIAREENDQVINENQTL